MTHRNLTVELRPRRLSELVGQEAFVDTIRNHFAGGNVPVVVMFTGDYGTGKTTLARILGLAFNCSHQTQWGEPCDECLENEDLFDIIERNCALMTTKDEMQEFIPILNQYPRFGRFRIIILDEMQQLSAAAQQLLLKVLEEKDSVNIFIIGTTNPEKINQGIKDRCVPFAIPTLSTAAVSELVLNTMSLAKNRFGIESRDPAPLVKELNDAYITSSRNIIMATDMYLSGIDPKQAIVIKEAGEVDYFKLANAVSWGNWEETRKLLRNAKPPDAAAIKMRVSWFFRDKLLASPVGQRAELLSRFIKELGDASAVESGLELSMVVSCLYQICQLVNDAKAAKTSSLTRVA